MQRAELVAQLGRQRFDLLIIGGGIVGAGIARDAALRGLRVALIEQGDFASGTSSKTSKLIHGGLRYLEHGHLNLVLESLRERATLRRIAPALVEPFSLLLPVFRGDVRPAWKIQLGLWAYALLAWGDALRSHRMVAPAEALELEPRLAGRDLCAAGLYADCQMDDARLCLANILSAIEAGAVCCNYVRLEMLLRSNGQLRGGACQDLLNPSSYEIQARVVVNATGPWGDRVRRLSQANAPRRMAPTKGIHLILPPIVRHGLFVQARADRRMLFLLPWAGSTLVGTTESPLGESCEPLRATSDEVGYLLEEVNRILPEARVGEADVVATFAGARPLLAFSGSAGAASREHRIEVDRAGLLSVLGGKYTTYRRMAREAVELVCRRARRAITACSTDRRDLIQPADPTALEPLEAAARSLDADVLGRLLAHHGRRAVQLLTLLQADRSLAQPVCAHHPDLLVEVAHALRHELACTVTDVLARRTRIVWSPCHGLDGLAAVASVFERYGGIVASRFEQQAAAYRHFVADGVSFRR